ncbi:THUMP-like domain-containing protein [Corynebacterium epidermidicanis]|uniref:THUMP-like domain-containing protein n=1 Tax=Corynebacterium epidermidicanis TaxID=1050174 RepID=A0A0G3GNV1_9CORY|nr:hypothetical protein [Corynebacterium epidermidicanis]AKK02906.1 hypothetical protein CEPID_05185 [Corynebacterium epidermidicanis]
MSFSVAEVHFLHNHRQDIAEVGANLSFRKADAIKDAGIVRAAFGSMGRAVIELLQARQSGKLPTDWLMDHDSAQQATPLPVVARRAQRIEQFRPGALVHDVTCSIGTEATGFSRYIGSDLDKSRVLMAHYNVGVPVCVADALQSPVSADVVIADPARRAGGRRIVSPDQLLPPLPKLLELPGELAVKCAPGLDFSQWHGLVSVVSVAGGVKEACLYTPGLAGAERREAVVITDRGVDVVTDLEPGAEQLADVAGRYVIDPDGAIVRAGLVRQFAVREGLWMLDERIAYLTGDRIPAGYSGFEIEEIVPLKKLKAALQARDCGSVEILVRGVDADPDEVRRKLKLRGRRPMAAVLTRIGSQGVALVCQARQHANES